MKDEIFFTDRQFATIMEQVVTPQVAAITELKDTIKEIKQEFQLHKTHDEEQQEHIVRIMTQADDLMKTNENLQATIKGMPGDMYKRFEQITEKRFQAVEKLADIANRSAQSSISECREDEPARITASVVKEVANQFREFGKKFKQAKLSLGQMITICTFILLAAGAAVAGPIMVSTYLNDKVVQVEHALQEHINSTRQ